MMADRNELQDLWQSQPLKDKYGMRAPTFALLEDQTAPVSYPLERGNRFYVVFWCFYILTGLFRSLDNPSPLERAGAWLGIAAAVGAAIALFSLPSRQPLVRPEASLAEYRSSLLDEYRRQARVEVRALLPFVIVLFGSVVLISVAGAMEHGWTWETVLEPVAVIASFALIAHVRRRMHLNAMRRLQYEVDVGDR